MQLVHSILSAAEQVGLSEPPPNAGHLGLGTLTAYSGPMTLSTPDTTISNKNISGGILINANNITLSNCLITGDTGDTAGIDQAGGKTGLVLDHVTIDMSGSTDAQCCMFTGQNYEITNCEFIGSENGIFSDGGTGLISGCYIHDLDNSGVDPHFDGIQLAGAENGVVISGNWIESKDTSGIIIKADFDPINDVTVTGNTIKRMAGETYVFAIYVYDSGGGATTNVTITNNRIQSGWGGPGGAEGEDDETSYIAIDAENPVFTGNVDYFTGDPLTLP